MVNQLVEALRRGDFYHKPDDHDIMNRDNTNVATNLRTLDWLQAKHREQYLSGQRLIIRSFPELWLRAFAVSLIPVVISVTAYLFTGTYWSLLTACVAISFSLSSLLGTLLSYSASRIWTFAERRLGRDEQSSMGLDANASIMLLNTAPAWFRSQKPVTGLLGMLDAYGHDQSHLTDDICACLSIIGTSVRELPPVKPSESEVRRLMSAMNPIIGSIEFMMFTDSYSSGTQAVMMGNSMRFGNSSTVDGLPHDVLDDALVLHYRRLHSSFNIVNTIRNVLNAIMPIPSFPRLSRYERRLKEMLTHVPSPYTAALLSAVSRNRNMAMGRHDMMVMDSVMSIMSSDANSAPLNVEDAVSHAIEMIHHNASNDAVDTLGAETAVMMAGRTVRSVIDSIRVKVISSDYLALMMIRRAVDETARSIVSIRSQWFAMATAVSNDFNANSTNRRL